VSRSILTVPVRKFGHAVSVEEQDLLSVEEPLQILVGDRGLAVTMRTPGHDADLAAGFLFTEGLIRHGQDIADIKCGRNTAVVTLAEGVTIDLEGTERNFYMTSSCGICGKASIEALETAGATILPPGVPKLDEFLIRSLPAKLRESQAAFDRTGGLHASGLFSAQGRLIVLREDVGRHNAVDKLIGRALLDGRLPLHDHVLMVSGRTSFELVQKAVMGAPSSLAVKTARRFGMTLVGFLRHDRFNVYSGADRVYESR
jgi:FdhD protein